MKTLCTTILLLCAFVYTQAQDIIIKNDKSEIKCKVTEIAETSVKYKNWDNLTGPVYSIAKADVFMIRYENGTTENFDAEAKPTPSQQPKQEPAPEKKEVSRGIRLGGAFYNPLLSSISNLGNPGSSGNFMIQYVNIPNSTTRWMFGSTIQILSATATNFNKEGYDVSFLGYGIYGKAAYSWHRDNSGTVYSGLSIGGIFGSISVSDPAKKAEAADITGIAYQIDLIGAQIHRGHFGIFSEFGFGYEGILKTGVQIVW